MPGKANAAQSKLQALLQRQAEIRAALRAEKEKRKASDDKDFDRLSRIIGRALLKNAAQFPDFDLMLRGVLKTTMTEKNGDTNFLKAKGWL